MNAFLVCRDDVQLAVGVDIRDLELRADSGVVVDQVTDELNFALGRPADLEPVNDGWLSAARIVAVVGEIYVRLDPYANGHMIEELEKRGLRCRLAPLNEWLMYCTDNELQRFSENRVLPGDSRLGAHITQKIQEYIVNHLYGAAGKLLGWKKPHSARDIVQAATPYLSPELISEAVLSLGVPVEAFRSGEIDGVVAVGPHECMPNKIVESQLFHVCEHTGMHTLAVSVNGEPIDPDILDRFAFEVLDSYEK